MEDKLTQLPEGFSRYDAADHLETIEDAAFYLEVTMQESGGDPQRILHALGVIARSRNMSELARRTGMSREGLYKALSADGNPSFATISRVTEVLGLRLEVRSAA